MVRDIIWTEKSKEDLRDIYIYYNLEASKQVGEKITNDIVQAVQQLVKQPESGQRELLLNNRSQNPRYLTKGNYKIIYWVEASQIYIASIFDCRQNPEKITGTL